MPKRVGKKDELFQQLISDENLTLAIDEVNRTHHWRTHHRPNGCTAWVEETKAERVKELRSIIVNGFEQKPPKHSRRWDASAQKWREVNEPAQWPDQYVHHALIQVLQPVLMRGMDPYCCGSIRGRGPHHARKAIERWMEKDPQGTKYEFSGDIYHFYASLKPHVVMARMRQLIKDRLVLDLISPAANPGRSNGTAQKNTPSSGETPWRQAMVFWRPIPPSPHRTPGGRTPAKLMSRPIP